MDLAVLAVVAVVVLTTVATMWLNRVWDRWWSRRNARTYKPRRYRPDGEPAQRTLNPARGSGPATLPAGGPNEPTYPLPRPLPLPPPPAVGRVRIVQRLGQTYGRRRNSRRY